MVQPKRPKREKNNIDRFSCLDKYPTRLEKNDDDHVFSPPFRPRPQAQ